MEPNPNFGNVVSPHSPDPGEMTPPDNFASSTELPQPTLEPLPPVPSAQQPPTPTSQLPLDPTPAQPEPSREELKPQRHSSLPFILAIVATIIAIGLGVLAIYYVLQYNKEKTTVESQKAKAAEVARSEQKTQDETAFAKEEKFPYSTYEVPAVLGAIKVEYPKTWSVFAIQDESAATQLDVFMSPQVVLAEKNNTEPYAFRMKLEQKLYTESIKKYQSLAQKGQVTAEAVVVSGISGTRFNGQIDTGRTGSIILLPIRDKTLSLWTEAEK